MKNIDKHLIQLLFGGLDYRTDLRPIRYALFFDVIFTHRIQSLWV